MCGQLSDELEDQLRTEMTDSRCVLVADLIHANPELSIDQAASYAAQMVAAEQREDYLEMFRVQQEALFGARKSEAA
jgi:hypothetical protein